MTLVLTVILALNTGVPESVAATDRLRIESWQQDANTGAVTATAHFDRVCTASCGVAWYGISPAGLRFILRSRSSTSPLPGEVETLSLEGVAIKNLAAKLEVTFTHSGSNAETYTVDLPTIAPVPRMHFEVLEWTQAEPLPPQSGVRDDYLYYYTYKFRVSMLGAGDERSGCAKRCSWRIWFKEGDYRSQLHNKPREPWLHSPDVDGRPRSGWSSTTTVEGTAVAPKNTAELLMEVTWGSYEKSSQTVAVGSRIVGARQVSAYTAPLSRALSARSTMDFCFPLNRFGPRDTSFPSTSRAFQACVAALNNGETLTTVGTTVIALTGAWALDAWLTDLSSTAPEPEAPFDPRAPGGTPIIANPGTMEPLPDRTIDDLTSLYIFRQPSLSLDSASQAVTQCITMMSRAATVADDACRERSVHIVGSDVPEAAAHRKRAIALRNPSWVQLRYIPRAERKLTLSESWYTGIQPCVDHQGTGNSCDEFPNFSTDQSGPIAGASLALIKSDDNSLEGTRFGTFLGTCRVQRLETFLVVPLTGPTAPTSMPVCRA